MARSFQPRVPHDVLQDLLLGYDPAIAARLVQGFATGFSLGCEAVPVGDCVLNLRSCEEAPQVIDRYIESEREAGRIAGPFPIPSPWIQKFSPIGLIPKKSPGTYRVIHHLSFPFGNSVNDYIPRERTAVSYGSIDQAVQLISQFQSPYLAKTDIASAFRMIPVSLSDCPLLGFRWRDAAFVDLALPMGCSSSSSIFQCFSDALVWMAQTHFQAGPIVSVLDDFLFIGESQAACATSLAGFKELCRQLCVPLRPDKTVDPCQSLCFLGVELDVATNELRLPPDKVARTIAELNLLLRRKKARLREVQACIGRLNFACIAVPLGRPFLRRLSDLCIGVRRPHHRVSINRAARLDMRAWLDFLSHFNGRSMLVGRRWRSGPLLRLETDASGAYGLGAICGSAWLIGTWPQELKQLDIAVKELIAVVVAIYVWRSVFAHRCVQIRSDNAAVVECINSQSSRSPAIMIWIRKLFVTVVLNDILVSASHVPGITNCAADALSRGLVQEFRERRPAAHARPTAWDWSAFGISTPSQR